MSLTREIRAVSPASGNNCGQLAQASFYRFHFPTMGFNFWSIGDTLPGNRTLKLTKGDDLRNVLFERVHPFGNG